MLKLGNINLEVPFFQAPLSGYSDRAMRSLARQFGCPLTFSGVLLDKSACYKPLFKKPNYVIKDFEHPIGGQILGTDPETMASAAKNLRQAGYDIVDLNFACPAPKVLRRGRGGAMLNSPAKVIEIYKHVRAAIDCPLLVKLRSGLDDSSQSRENFWQICEQLGGEDVDALIVHGRSAAQLYRGQANWDIPAELKRKLPRTTIIGSGDLFEAHDVVNKLKTSGIDGVVIARGAIGNPWLFRQINDVLAGADEVYKPDLAEQGAVILQHFELLRELYDAGKSVRYFRKFLANYSKSHPQQKKVKLDFVGCKNEEQLRKIVMNWYGSANDRVDFCSE